MDAGWSAFLIGDAGGTRRDCHRDLVLLCGHVDRRQPRCGVAEIGDHVDVLSVEPVSSEIRGDVRLVCVVGGDNLDRLTQHLTTEIANGHSNRKDCSWPCDVRKKSGHVRKHADLYDIVGYLGGCIGRGAGKARYAGNRRSQERNFRDPHRGTLRLLAMVRRE